VTAHVELARRYFEGGSFERCLHALSQAGEGALEHPQYWFLRAESLRKLGRPEEAVRAARTGLAGQPEHIGLLDSLGLSLVALGDIAAGDESYRAALSLAPEHPVLLSHHAVALARLDSLDDARRVVSMLMAVAPDSITALEARAQVAFRARDSAADRYVAELLARDPENQNGHVLRGQLASRRRQARPAAEAFGEAAALNPGNVSVARAARAFRIAANPLLAPTRSVLMLGRKRALFVYIVVVVGLFALGQPTLAFVFAGLWFVFMAVMPRVLRRYYRKRYGEL